MSVNIENFEIIFGIKNNIQALRNKVLELAIHGKLVEQNPNDEPASELVKKIQVERNKLVKEGKIKNQKPLALISEEEVLFQIPDTWKWVRFDEINKLITCGYASTPTYVENGMPFISAKNVKPYKFLPDDHKFISNELYEKLTKTTKPEKNDILLTRVGAGIGESAIIDIEMDFAIYVSLTLIKPYHKHINARYILNWLNSPEGVKKAFDNTYGGNVSQGNLNVKNVKQYLIPLPPINEQHRIVQKTESLMSEIGKLEEALQKKQHFMELLPKSIIEVIGKCKTGEELREQLRFVIENFEAAFQTPESMQELRNVVLQLAIEGKLVPQHATDEPASALVKRIQVEKDKLVKEGKIKKQQSLEPIGEEDIPFEIPMSWEWVRLGTITSYGDNITLSPEDISDEAWVLELEDIEKNSSKILNILYNKKRQVKSNKNKFFKGDVLYGKLRPYLRKITIAPNDGVCTTEIIAFRGYCDISAYYIVNYLKSQYVDKYVNSITHGMNMPRLGTDNAKALVFPLPPIKEQHRIVQKVESIMALIDQMEVELKRKGDLVEKMASI